MLLVTDNRTDPASMPRVGAEYLYIWVKRAPNLASLLPLSAPFTPTLDKGLIQPTLDFVLWRKEQ
jgi:hypothetical protein